jgi:5-methylcytosine-specific restriction endonuclease McrA
MEPLKLSKEFLERLTAVTAKRPKIVIDHILKHGFVTTEELRTKYGYGHPPRAAKDVRDQGIPLETTSVKGSDGRRIAAYRFADLSKIRRGFLGGRQAFSKEFKASLVKAAGSRCQICLHDFEDRYLQIDHRIPYEVAGDVAFGERDSSSYMLVDASCNRAKSWSCEQCRNWTELKSPETCRTCYWASPNSYVHIAMQDTRRIDLTWAGGEVEVYEALRTQADALREQMPRYAKRILQQAVHKEQ